MIREYLNAPIAVSTCKLISAQVFTPCDRIDGLLAGLMLVSRHYAEKTIYRAECAFEQSPVRLPETRNILRYKAQHVVR